MKILNKINPTGLIFFLIVATALLLAACGQGDEQPSEAIVAVPPTATNTPTPFPSATPTATPSATPTATPSNTPTPLPTPLPQVVLEISGPEIVPPGLPQATTWEIKVVQGAELVIVSIDDLGGVMLTGDENDELDLIKTLVPADAPNVAVSFESAWTIFGIVDPNIGRGVLTLLIETGNYQETVTLPWIASSTDEIQRQVYTIAMDGRNQEPTLDLNSTAEVSRPGFNRYETINALTFEYPQAWFVNEFQDGTVQLSSEPLASTDGATPADVAYASFIAGDRERVGIPIDIPLDPDAIIDWLLGDVTNVGGEQGGLFLSDELQVISRGSLKLEDGSTTSEVVLKPLAEDGETAVEARYIVSVKEDDRLFILTAFDPSGDFAASLPAVINSIAFK